MIVRKLLFFLGIVILLPASIQAKAPSWLSTLSFPQEIALKAPAALTIDSERQRYYVVDYTGSRLISFDQKGTKISEFNASGALDKPVDLAFGRSGKMWVVERNTNELLYIDLTTQNIRRFDLTKTTGELLFIDRIATDNQQRLYVTNSHSGRILRLDDNLKIDVIFAAQADSQLIDFKIKGRELYALDNRHHQLLRFSLDGKRQQVIKLNGKLDSPVSFEIDDKGLLYILDRALGKVVVMDSNGNYRYDFGRHGYRRGQFNYPAQLVFNWQQQLCVVNQGNDRIEVFSH